MISRLIKMLYRVVPAWQPTMVVAVTILFLTLAADPLGDEPIQLFEGADKVVHAIMFGALSGVIALDRFMSGHDDKALTLWVIAAVSMAAGGIIEVVQQMMGLGRTGDIADFVADAVGAVMGIGIFVAVRKGLRRSRG